MTSDEFSKSALTAVVAAFEERLADGEPVDWRSYLPSITHPDFKNFALEMILVDIHHQWRQGAARRTHDYLAELPSAFRQDASFLRAVATEEWRCRRRSGSQIDLGLLLAEYNLPDDGARPLDQPEPRPHQLAKRLSEELDAVLAKSPEPFGFRVVEALGSGQLSRVFLAEQQRIGGRQIVVKVGIGQAREIDALGRLHHENIIPLYWAERDPPYYVLCMPFFGRATLQRLIREADRKARGPSARLLWDHLGGRVGFRPATRSAATFEEGALWLTGRVARGLAHAHAKGIVHGDVKPANILLASNGEPLLLDFNLASVGDRLPVGGTFHYMSPEQLDAFHTGAEVIKPPSDIFNLGVVLYELVCGKRPFPDRSARLDRPVDQMLDDRRRGVDWEGPRVSPSVRAIVETCLAYRPEDRYQSCEELLDDVERHLEDKPLRRAPNSSLRELGRKQVNRTVAWFAKPRPFKAVLGVACAAVLGAAFAVYQGLALNSASQRAALHKKLDSLRFGFNAFEGRIDRTVASLRAIESMEKQRPIAAGWTEQSSLLWLGSRAEERQALASAARQVELLAARAVAPFRKNPEALPRQPTLQSGDIDLLHRSLARFPASNLDDVGPRDLPPQSIDLLGAVRLIESGLPDRAKQILDELTDRRGGDFWTWFWRYKCDLARGQTERALLDLQFCLGLRPADGDLLLLRSTCFLELGLPKRAERDADALILAGYELGEAHWLRGLARLLQADAQAALADFDLASVHGADGPRLRMLSAQAATMLGQTERARSEIAAVERVPARSLDDWSAVAVVRLQAREVDWDAVAAAFERAGELDPNNSDARVARELALLVLGKITRSAGAILQDLPSRPGKAAGWETPFAEALLRSGRFTVAAGFAFNRGVGSHDPVLCVQMASVLARLAARFADVKQRDLASESAVRLLTSARDLGGLSAAALSSPEFDVLRRRPDFRGLTPSSRLQPPPPDAPRPSNASLPSENSSRDAP